MWPWAGPGLALPCRPRGRGSLKLPILGDVLKPSGAQKERRRRRGSWCCCWCGCCKCWCWCYNFSLQSCKDYKHPKSQSCTVARESVPDEQCETNSDIAELRSGRVRGNFWGQVHFSICACHPCAGAMPIFSVLFQFYRMIPEGNPQRVKVQTANQKTAKHSDCHIGACQKVRADCSSFDYFHLGGM